MDELNKQEMNSVDLLSSIATQDKALTTVDRELQAANTVIELDMVLNCVDGVDVTALRKILLKKGVPDVFKDESKQLLRFHVWKILLGVPCSFEPIVFMSKAEVIEMPHNFNVSPFILTARSGVSDVAQRQSKR